LFWIVGRRFTKEEVNDLTALENATAYK
jgi:hypothetical protein